MEGSPDKEVVQIDPEEIGHPELGRDHPNVSESPPKAILV